MKIPEKFKLFGTTYTVIWDSDRMNEQEVYGECDSSRSIITLCRTDGKHPLSEDVIINTFYHEKTHAILDMMSEHELSRNEKFVEIFSKLLRQADETSEFSLRIFPEDAEIRK